MAFDSIALTALMAELETLVGARVSRIQQPSQLETVFTMRGSNGNKRLLISAHPERARIPVSYTHLDVYKRQLHIVSHSEETEGGFRPPLNHRRHFRRRRTASCYAKKLGSRTAGAVSPAPLP